MSYGCECGQEFKSPESLHGHMGAAHARIYYRREIIHGSTAGYRAHIRREEKPCSACKRAWRTYRQKKRKTA